MPVAALSAPCLPARLHLPRFAETFQNPSGWTRVPARSGSCAFANVRARPRSAWKPVAPASVLRGRRSFSHTRIAAGRLTSEGLPASASCARSCLAVLRAFGLGRFRFIAVSVQVFSNSRALRATQGSGRPVEVSSTESANPSASSPSIRCDFAFASLTFGNVTCHSRRSETVNRWFQTGLTSRLVSRYACPEGADAYLDRHHPWVKQYHLNFQPRFGSTPISTY